METTVKRTVQNLMGEECLKDPQWYCDIFSLLGWIVIVLFGAFFAFILIGTLIDKLRDRFRSPK